MLRIELKRKEYFLILKTCQISVFPNLILVNSILFPSPRRTHFNPRHERIVQHLERFDRELDGSSFHKKKNKLSKIVVNEETLFSAILIIKTRTEALKTRKEHNVFLVLLDKTQNIRTSMSHIPFQFYSM